MGHSQGATHLMLLLQYLLNSQQDSAAVLSLGISKQTGMCQAGLAGESLLPLSDSPALLITACVKFGDSISGIHPTEVYILFLKGHCRFLLTRTNRGSGSQGPGIHRLLQNQFRRRLPGRVGFMVGGKKSNNSHWYPRGAGQGRPLPPLLPVPCGAVRGVLSAGPGCCH